MKYDILISYRSTSTLLGLYGLNFQMHFHCNLLHTQEESKDSNGSSWAALTESLRCAQIERVGPVPPSMKKDRNEVERERKHERERGIERAAPLKDPIPLS